ncbi:acyl-CoA dehydrogenase [Asanoa ferruginea]|uniref:Acyl-CoA dehydrogenase n=1 Tax=Asanoa ferruginea TaxID=53367 RepID=A0A3D9ZLH8_9ACTN|nr:acyl-CoA dehydrogenase family protein [Asanoa ferruginea]REF98125.1 acyl-CoA dehydrogenase [Asanoa ferruginea]GIF49581.1 acyl-CoA dehydrogenase [Asanoa ferruginea]
MDFGFDQRTGELHEAVNDFLIEQVYPAEPVFTAQMEQASNKWTRPPIIDDLKTEARRRGLWNLFLPGAHGAGLSNLQYAPLAELLGRSPHLAPEALNCAAPDTGNMELLAEFGSPEQQARWLSPLLEGTIRSAFCMTEPEVASSDATNIATTIRRDGDDYVIDGRKWWSSGAMDPRCEIFIVMGKTDPSAERHKQQSMILVPRDTPGVSVLRGMTVFGFTDGSHGGHAEITFDGVRVPASSLIAMEGDGFGIAQARLGPGRIHHCMRLIGMAERALELLCARTASRAAFGKPLSEQGVVRDWIAESRVRIEQARLLVLKTAWLMDTVGNKGAHTEIQAIKIATPSMAEWVIDKAIQAHGAAGVSQDTPLAALWTSARTLRLADGPDEVHRASLARRELRKWSLS